MSSPIRTLERPGSTLSFSDSSGSGGSVIFTHGAGVDRTMFDSAAHVAHDAGHRVITWDLRGHGESTLHPGARFRAEDALDDLLALIAHLDLQRPTLVGHSLGGNLSQEIVRRHPALCGGLIIVDSTWNAGPLTALERLGLRLAAPLLAMVPASRLPRLMADASATTEGGVDYARRCFERMPK